MSENNGHEEATTTDEPEVKTKINDEEVSETEIEDWLNSLDDETKEEKKDDKPTGEYVTKKDLENAISKIAETMKNNDEDHYSQDDNEDKQKQITIEQIKELIQNQNQGMKKEFLNVLEGNQIDKNADMFEGKVKEKYPDFKIDKLHLEFDVKKGMTIEKALEKQFKEEQKRILSYKKNFDSGVYKIEVPDEEKNINLNEGLPVELKDFNPEQHNDRKEFKKAYPDTKARDAYFRKLDLWEETNKNKK